MISIRDRNERGPTKTNWLDSKHSFSFGYYQDPNHMGFGPLRVLNEDTLINPGDIQRMSAGTGITHSEYNASKIYPVHFLQIWFLPEKTGIQPSYEQKSVNPETTRNKFKLIISPDGRQDSITINQDINGYVGRLDGYNFVKFKTSYGRIQWIQIAKGAVDLNNKTLRAGDGAAILGEDTLFFNNADDAEVLVFDMQDINSSVANNQGG